MKFIVTALLLFVRIILMSVFWFLSWIFGCLHEYSALAMDYVDHNIGGLKR